MVVATAFGLLADGATALCVEGVGVVAHCAGCSCDVFVWTLVVYWWWIRV